jgi:hypothetical protein
MSVAVLNNDEFLHLQRKLQFNFQSCCKSIGVADVLARSERLSGQG